MADVKPRASRAEQAARTRRRMLDRARTRFIADGYAATTMERIAADAGVAVQTVYYTFRTKGRLLREVVEGTAADDPDPVPVAERPWMREVLGSRSAQRILALTVEHGVAIYVRAAPLWPAVATAAVADPEIDAYWREVAAGRRAGQARMIARLAELGALREGLDPVRATDLVVVLFGHDVFRGFVVDLGWTVPDYQGWLFTTLVDQLLERRKVDHAAVSGLSFAAHLRR